MVHVNRCYARGDVEGIFALILEWEAGAGPVESESIGEQLDHARQVIASMLKRIQALNQEILTLEQSRIAVLQRDAEVALAEGRDRIGELIESLDRCAAAARERLDRLRAEGARP